MARVVIPLQDQLNHDITKLTQTPANSVDGMEFSNNGFVKLIFVASAAFAGGTVTILSVTDSNRRTGNIVKTIAASEVWESSFFEVSLFGSAGKTLVDISVASGLTVSAVRQQL